jgi:SEC-C motif-containing protein
VSFGPAASGSSADGFVRVDPRDTCPCGSGETFEGCCRPLLSGTAAPTAERLMRSRYAAFVVGDTRYLSESWHPRARPEALTLDPQLRWAGLEIIETEAGGDDDTSGVVEFRAAWRRGADQGILHERSRFARQGGRWWYVDGAVF